MSLSLSLNLHQSAQAEVVLGQLSTYLASWIWGVGAAGRMPTEYTECLPSPLFDILLSKYYPAG